VPIDSSLKFSPPKRDFVKKWVANYILPKSVNRCNDPVQKMKIHEDPVMSLRVKYSVILLICVLALVTTLTLSLSH